MSILVALLAAVGFAGSGLLAMWGSIVPSRVRGLAVAVAAGILLALAFGDLFPESLELAGRGATAGFIGGFALLFLIETATHAHTHHALGESAHHHALIPFILGLGIHNLTDGFAIGVSGQLSAADAGLVGLGVLIHQLPVGLSLAAVFIEEQVRPRQVARIAVLLGLAIPFATIVTVALPDLGDESLGTLIGVAGGVLTYLGAAHLLPEAQTEHPHRITGLVFTLTLVVTSLTVLTVLRG